MSELNCAAYRDDLLWYAAGHINGEKRATIEAHLAGCADCRAEVAQWRGIATSIHHDKGDVPPATFNATWQRIQAQLPPQPHLNGSVILTGVIHMEFESDAQSVTPIKTRQSQQSPAPRRTKWFALAATLLVVIMGIAVFGVLHTRNQESGPGTSSAVTLPAGARLALPTNWFINKATIVSADDIWGVGAIAGKSKKAPGGDALILHYTAGSWQVVSSNDFANSVLESITMVSATEGWAVGFTNTYPQTPAPTASANGGSPAKQTSVPLILHYQNGAWKKVAAPAFSGTLFNVQMGTNDEGVATGFDVNDAPTVLLHYVGGVWSNNIAAPPSSSHSSTIPTYGITGDSGLLASSDQGVYRFQNNAWQPIKNPITLVPQSSVADIAVTGSNDVWAILVNGTSADSKLAHFDGTNWNLISIPSSTLPAGQFIGGFVPHSTWLTVARSGSDTNLFLHRDNDQWKASTMPFNNLLGIKDTSATTSSAIGSNGQNGVQVVNIYHYQNGAWS